MLIKIRLIEEDPRQAEALALEVCQGEGRLFPSSHNHFPLNPHGKNWYEFYLFGGDKYREAEEKVKRITWKALAPEIVEKTSRSFFEIEIEDPATGLTLEGINIWALAKALRRTGEAAREKVPATVEVSNAAGA